jgi:hypothetical protein
MYVPPLAQVFKDQPTAAMKGLEVNHGSSSCSGNESVGRKGGKNQQQQDTHKKTIVQYFQKLVCDVWSSNSTKTISPRAMTSNIRRVGRQFRPMRQEDAHEYLRQLLDCMHEEVLKANKVKSTDAEMAETTLISRVFGGAGQLHQARVPHGGQRVEVRQVPRQSQGKQCITIMM